MLTNIPIVNIIIGVTIAFGSINMLRYILEKHRDEDGEIIKWTVWSAGSINIFFSSIMGFLWGIGTALISIFRLF